MNELWELFLTFCKIGAFTFGGGYAMLPMIEKEIVENKRWATKEEISNYYAIGQCTPGVIAVNTATFIGYMRKRVPGAIAATLGVVTPSIVIIMIIAAFLQNFMDILAVQYAFAGIRVAVVVLILNTVISLWKAGIKDGKGILIFIATVVAVLFFEISTVTILIAVIVLSLLVEVYKKMRGRKV